MSELGKLFFTKTHEWIRYEERKTAVAGLSAYAQKQLGDIVYVNLPEEGDEIEKDSAFADVESVKAVSDLYAPVSGIVLETNTELIDAPELINQSPYDAWIVRIGEITEEADLMDEEEYERYLRELTKH